MPINVEKFHHLLQESGYDSEKTKFLIDGLTNGFSLEYTGSHDCQKFSANLLLRIGDKIDLWNKVMGEVELNRYAGPFLEPPFENFIQSPIGLVPKDGGKKMRLIFHLSHPRIDGTSVNLPVYL